MTGRSNRLPFGTREKGPELKAFLPKRGEMHPRCTEREQRKKPPIIFLRRAAVNRPGLCAIAQRPPRYKPEWNRDLF